MKKSLLTLVSLLAFSFFASAQETPRNNNNEDAQDKIQQEAPRAAQLEVERSASQSAKRAAAEKKSKQKEKKINEVQIPKKTGTRIERKK